jgi:hypothetical protein
MRHDLNKLKQIIQKSQGRPNISVGGWLQGNLEDPNDDLYIYVENKKSAIDFDNQIDAIWKKEKVIHDNISKKSLKKELKSLLKEKLQKQEDFVENDWTKLRDSFCNIKSVQYEIFKELKGCNINSKEPIKISNFTFYDWPKHYKIIKEKYPKAFEQQYPSFYDEKISMTLLSTIINSKDCDRADEIADIKFKKIENILRYLFTDSSYSHSGLKHSDIGIFDFREKEWHESQTVTTNSKGGNLKPIGTYRNLVLNKKLLTRKKHINKIWEILDKEKPNKLEIRILNSIEWIGKAKHEIEKEKAFIQFFFAIESLMNFNEFGIISPSITSQMKEYTAFILGKNKNERIEIDKLFTQLYGIRSSIVHGSSKEITDYDLEDVQNISERLVFEFLTNTKLNSIKSDNNFKELKDFISSLKYSSY